MRDVNQIIEKFINIIVSEIQVKEKVNITNFGTFKKTKSKAFEYFSPIDGSKVKTEGIFRISFSSSKELLKKVSMR